MKILSLRAIVNALSNVRYPALYVALAGLVVSAAFSFVAYPYLANPYHLVLDPDHHGNLGYGLWKYHTFSYFPEHEPTVERGPLYPLFIALLLIVTRDWWPYCVQLGQCILFSLICLMVFWTSKTLWDKRIAFLTAALCVVHPLMLWYTSRIWIETMATFLFTALVASILYFSLRPTLLRGVLVGCVLGLSALCKSTFLAYVFVVPVVLLCLPPRKMRLRSALTVSIVALILVLPWSVRNWRLTGKFIPVHGRLGFNLQVGDGLIENISKSPFSLVGLYAISMEKMAAVESRIPADLSKHEREILLDSILLRDSMTRYREHPGFLLKKMLLNSWLFWTLGEMPRKTLVLSLLLVPLAGLFAVSAIVTGRRGQLRTIRGVHISLVVVYYLMHLPVEAIARYSVVLVPTMLIYAVGTTLESVFKAEKHSSRGNTEAILPPGARTKALLAPTESGFAQMVRFGVAGAVATVGDYAVLLGLYTLAHVSRPLAVAAGYGVGLIICYVLSIVWIFPHRTIQDRRIEFTIFMVIGVVGLVLTEVVVHVSMMIISQPAAAAHLSDTMQLSVAKFVSVVLVFFFNFGVRKAILFMPPKAS